MTQQTQELDLTPYEENVYTAHADAQDLVIATSNNGTPDLAFKGSFLVWDKDHLAYWERSLNETLAAIKSNPKVSVVLRHKGPPARFYGEASVVEDEKLREAIWEKVNEDERGKDAQKKGVAVLIRVDKIRQGPNTITRS